MEAPWNTISGAGRLRNPAGGSLWRLAALAAACAAGLPMACAPAPVRPNARQQTRSGLALSGEYDASFSAPFVGTFRGRILAEPTRDGFRANSRPGAAWPLVGGVEGFLGPIFMPYLFPGGVILGWSSSLPAEGKPGEGWLGPGGLRRYGVRTLMESADGPVRLVLPDGRAVAMMTLAPAGAPPTTDYSSVADGIEATIRARLFVQPVNGRTSPPPGLDAYIAQVHRSADLAQDDVEFAFGAAMAARANLKFFPLPLRRLDPDAERVLRSWPEKDLTSVQWSFDKRSGIGTIKPEVFLATADIDQAMTGVLGESPRALIIDLRGCQGVELSAFRMAAWLSETTVDAGTFYGLTGPESPQELLAESVSDFDSAGNALDRAGAVHIGVSPVENPFLGPVAILTSKRTAGTAEALAAVLRQVGRARIVGEPTAGRPVLSRPVDLGQGWLLRLPAAGWQPSGSQLPTGKALEPDLRASVDAAPTRAAEMLTGPDAGP